MSHFTVLVIGENIDEKLAPYSEELGVEPYIDIKREEIEKEFAEVRKEAIMGSFKQFQMYLDGYRGKVKRTPAYLQKYANEMSLSEFASEYYGQKVDENGNLLTTYNPNSKWDWYQIGGRWAGLLRVKDDTDGIRGNPSLLMDEFEYKSNEVDSAQFGDIDWEKMLHDPEQEKKLRDFWKSAINTENDKERFDKGILWTPKYYLDMYKTEDEYVRRLTLFSTYAVVTNDGVWHGKGDMGWWGISSESNDEAADWDDGFWNTFLANLDPDTLITIVDCHI